MYKCVKPHDLFSPQSRLLWGRFSRKIILNFGFFQKIIFKANAISGSIIHITMCQRYGYDFINPWFRYHVANSITSSLQTMLSFYILSLPRASEWKIPIKRKANAISDCDIHVKTCWHERYISRHAEYWFCSQITTIYIPHTEN